VNERSHLLILPKGDRIQQLQQQIEAWQALLESWEGMNERSHPFILRGASASSNYNSRLRHGKRWWKSWQGSLVTS